VTEPTAADPGLTPLTSADPRAETRPWGWFEVLEDADDCKVKRLTVTAGQRLSYQRHERRAEHWVVVQGRARVTLDGTDLELGVGDAIDIPRGAAHRLANPGREVMSLIEVQLGDYFGEDDITRLSDDYGRLEEAGP
jgi:mannose-6-phosphate isomerase-like protein (cupin superfamily)